MAAGYPGGMSSRRLVLAALAAVAALWWLQPIGFVAAVYESHLLDVMISLLMTGGFVLVARWVGWSGRNPAGRVAASITPPRSGFRTNPILWAGFAASIFVVFCGVQWQGPARESYFERLVGSCRAYAPPAELVGQAVGYAFAAT